MNGRRNRRKNVIDFTTKRVRERANNMKKKSNIVVQKYIDDLIETQKNKDLNDLDEGNKEAKEKVAWDV